MVVVNANADELPVHGDELVDQPKLSFQFENLNEDDLWDHELPGEASPCLMGELRPWPSNCSAEAPHQLTNANALDQPEHTTTGYDDRVGEAREYEDATVGNQNAGQEAPIQLSRVSQSASAPDPTAAVQRQNRKRGRDTNNAAEHENHSSAKHKTSQTAPRKGQRKAWVDVALNDERLRQYKHYENPQPQNGHLLQSFMPNGKRRCGILACINCGTCCCFIRMDDVSVETSLRSILHTPEGQSTDINKIVEVYFDKTCRSSCQRDNKLATLDQLGSVLSLHSGDLTMDTHAISQSIKRARDRQGYAYCNRAKPLSVVLAL